VPLNLEELELLPPERSVVGLHTIWTCAGCKRRIEIRQFVSVVEPDIESPAGWYIENGFTYCPDHNTGELAIPEGAD
jgi:hypothetical protein